jgi:hypothetical protein
MRSLTFALAISLVACSTPVAPAPTPTATGAGRATPAATQAEPGASPARESPRAPGGPCPTCMTWSRIADIPTPRSEVAAAVHQTTIYVIGGFGGRERVERYVAPGRWERVADLPHGVDHAMAASVSGLQTRADQGVFVFGGYVNGVATARSFFFDPLTGRWSEIPAMPGPRAAGAAVTLGSGSRIYIVGGAEGGRLVAPTYEYDVVRRSWRTVAAIPTPRDHLAAVYFEGRICAVGGRRLSMSANLGTLECYLPQDDKWEALPPAPTPRGGVGAAAWGRQLYLIGGEQPSGTFKEVEIYDASTGGWSRGPDLPTPRHGIGVVALQGVSDGPPWGIYVLTGGPTPGGSQTAICELLTLR